MPVAVPYANLTNPQTLNLYAMVADDPETAADLDGHTQNASQGTEPGERGGPTCAANGEGGGGSADSGKCGANQTASQTDPKTQAAVGIGKSLVNLLVDLINLLPAGDNKAGTAPEPAPVPELQPSNDFQKVAMITTSLALLVVPGTGDEKAATKGGEILTRFGKEAESAEKLAAQAAVAEEKIGVHGVSVTARPNPRTPGSSAPRSEVERAFKVHNTTGKDIFHRTVELAKPVTKAVAETFNSVFGRTPLP